MPDPPPQPARPAAAARTTGSAASRPLVRWRGWRPALWVVAVVTVALDWCVTLLVAAYQSLVHGGVCFEPAEVTGLQAAQRAMVLLVVLLAVPWLVTVRVSRHRPRTAVLAMAALVPAFLFTAQVLTSTPQDFSSSWCLY